MYYLKPSFLYPAASAYQLANGTIHRFSHGRLIMYFASEGADMMADQESRERGAVRKDVDKWM